MKRKGGPLELERLNGIWDGRAGGGGGTVG